MYFRGDVCRLKNNGKEVREGVRGEGEIWASGVGGEGRKGDRNRVQRGEGRKEGRKGGKGDRKRVRGKKG